MISSFLDGFSGKLFFFWWFSHLLERDSAKQLLEMSLPAGLSAACTRDRYLVGLPAWRKRRWEHSGETPS